MVRVGLTGGIGSGKTTVARVFKALGVPVYSTDRRAQELMAVDEHIVTRLTALLGNDTYRNGLPNRPYIASMIFGNSELVAQVNGIVHPRVAMDWELWARKQAAAKYVIMECAILYESGFDRLVDKVIAVTAPIEQRIERATSRDGSDPEDIRRRMLHQMSDEERAARADFVINNSDEAEILPQIIELHRSLTDEI